MTQAPLISLTIPDWLQEIHSNNPFISELGQRMSLVVAVARENIAHGNGPFAAAIFEQQSGKLLALGVNLVTAHAQCILHAEIVAIMSAQQHLGTYDLAADGLPDYQLVSSNEPCAMCLGAVCWSGVRSLVCGATTEDAAAIGFDEGPITSDWQYQLQQRGIEVITEIKRPAARSVLQDYQKMQGTIYNSNRHFKRHS